MTDKKGIIRNFGKELEEIVKNPGTSESTKILLGKAIVFGYFVGGCEARYEEKNDPYSAVKCIEKYENIKKLLKIN